MYPEGFATKVSLDGPASGLETAFRPHFFAGVATVVTKLFTQCRPDIAMFGEKDYQQLLVVRRLSRDLDLGVDVIGVPTVREADGLALSSRNAYLSADQRKIAAHLNRVLLSVGDRARAGVPVAQAEAEGAAALIGAGFDRVDYVAIRDADTLAAVANDRTSGACARRRAHRLHPADRQSSRLDQTQLRELCVQRFRQLGHFAAALEILGRILGIEITPALKRAMKPPLGRHKRFV